MKVVVQVVSNAKLFINEKVHASIDYGMLLLVGFTISDNPEIARKMVQKIALMRIFPDAEGKTNLALLDVGGSVLSVSQFTLYGVLEGRRPSFTKALKGEESSKLYDVFNEELAKLVTVETGVFGAEMNLEFTNRGPATYIVEL